MEVALFGAAGYSGLELVKLLAGHPRLRLRVAASDAQAGRALDEMTGHGTTADPRGPALTFVPTEAALAGAAGCAAALLAVPPEPALRLTAALRAQGVRVVDLSHAHRADPGVPYGLTSLFGEDVAAAPVVANPGCYATAVITAAAPLVRAGLVDGDVIVAAGSGVTGAGRASDEALGLGEMYGEVRAYKVLRHQHVPEIEAALARVAHGAGTAAPRVVLTTHLLPVARGILATLTARLRRPVDAATLTALLREAYADDPTVTIAPTPEEVSLRRVVGTATCRLGVASDDRGYVVLTAALDNLLKGAATQALENLNLMLGLPRLAGLAHLARHA